MNSQGGSREPGAKVLGPTGHAKPEPGFRPQSPDDRLHASPKQRAWRRFRRNRLAAGSALFLFAAGLLILVWPMFRRPGIAAHLPRAMTWSPTALSEEQFRAPSGEHWFGTDVHGRDLQSRVFYGARVSLLVGVQGWLEDLSVNISARVLLIVAGLGAISWLTLARIVRGQVLSLRTRGFVYASRALGASHARILLRHILPNVYGIIITYLTLTVPAIILYESFLSYLGLGIQPPQASLGSLLAEGAAQINPIRIYWWMIVHPGATLAATLLALNFLGDGLRDAWDPRTESE